MIKRRKTMDNFSVSVIVIVRNNNTVFSCLNELLSQIDHTDEIIVVDDYSDSDFAALLKDFCKNNGLIFLHSDIPGNRAHNRNIGAARANNPIMVFVDADIILNHKSIQRIKSAYRTKDNVAYIGTRCAGRYDPQHMMILGGIDVADELISHPDREYIEELPIIKDTRIKDDIYLESLAEQDFYWIYYYTCCCTVLSDVFRRIRGFAEDYPGWGVEDIDLGYRISQCGKIAFLRDFSGIHLPHNRSVIYAEQDNCFNLKRMLQKYQSFDIELISIYRMSAKKLYKFKTFLNRMRMIELTNIPVESETNILYVNPISLKNPYGNLLLIDQNGEKQSFNLMGISTFFEDKSISKVYISGNIVLYPLSVVCGILQESLRISNTVLMQSKLPNYRIDWGGFMNLTLLQPQKRNEYRIHDLVEFCFNKTSDHKYYRVTSDYLAMEDRKTVYPRIKLDACVKESIINKTFCAINLTKGAGYRLLISQLSNDYGLNITGTYNPSFSNQTFFDPDHFPKQLYPLLNLNTPILLIVEDVERFDFEFSDWIERKRGFNLIVDTKGNHFMH